MFIKTVFENKLKSLFILKLFLDWQYFSTLLFTSVLGSFFQKKNVGKTVGRKKNNVEKT